MMNMFTEQDLKDTFIKSIDTICGLGYEDKEFSAAIYELNNFYHQLMDKAKEIK